ncbi:hypothetical protein [Falsiroseomonas oryzae]|uniref:hypothetical protein n=1 Tax=Falsiroseomonas oryzae TaxID=2766473 RepID=UPI0022EA5FDA|nr:hypothetical protein [Roseomonas sp. MO-31]
MKDPETRLPERPAEPKPLPVAEPATPRALWPTFMRRTLPEDALRHERHVVLAR